MSPSPTVLLIDGAAGDDPGHAGQLAVAQLVGDALEQHRD
jgi:hypothetical protein